MAKLDKHSSALVELDVGCGENKRIGMIGIDLRKTVSTDVLGDVRMLPFRDESFDHVFSSHVIEHFGHREVSTVLAEWIRVLRKGGAIEIRCPDLRARAFLFCLSPNWHNVRDIYGEQDYDEDYHKCGFSFGLLRGLLESCGVRNLKRIIKGYKGIPFLPDSVHVIGIKR